MGTGLLMPMARETNGPRKHASELRWGDWSPADIRKLAAVLREQAAALDALAGTVADSGVKRLRIDGDKKPTEALKLLRVFDANVRKAFIDWQARG